MKVEKLDYFGRGIIKIDNKICFVKNALVNEDIDYSIISNKKKYMEAISIVIRNKSNDRQNPPCKYYDKCGGCMLQHMVSSLKVKFKKDKLRELLSRSLKQDINIKNIITTNEFNYRNKVTFHVINGRIGYYQDKTHQLIEIDNCLLLKNKINELLSYLKEYVKKENKITGITIKIGNKTDELMLIIEGNVNSYEKVKNLVDVLIINDKAVTLNDKITSMIGSYKYLVSKNSFFQINEGITEKLYNCILDVVKEKRPNTVLDLYCGTGTIGIYIAKYARKVISIEIVSDAIKDALINKKINNIRNISFINGSVEDNVDDIKESIDLVIVDPPRSGLKSNVIQFLLNRKPETIVYVSCNPITLSRDLNMLNSLYDIIEVTPFDMFPNTYHVECVCVLCLR